MTHVSVCIVGSGFAGLGTAIALKKAGRHDFVVLERASDVGGTWRDNSYPGCACDVPSHVYSFSFAPNPDWSHSFSRQPEIYAYLQKTARDYDVLPQVRFGTEVTDARWDASRQLWEIETTTGPLTADVMVSGTGGLSDPALPDLPGLSTFTGKAFHSARWDHSWSATGERVGVIGTGASAIQFVPFLQKDADSLVLFQRTPPWVLPRRDRKVTALEKKLFARIPALQKAMRGLIYAGRETNVLGFRNHFGIMRLAEKQALSHLRRQVPDPVLRAKLTPTYTLGCKRVLLSNTYYPAVAAPNSSVVTDPIVQVVPNGVVTEATDGTRTTHEVDTLVFGTGFNINDQPIARVISADGVPLSEHWKDSGMQALHGLTVAGYPNLFFLLGPNTALGHNSVVLMIEAQIGHLMRALDALDANTGALEARADVQAAYNARIQRELAPTVWSTGGCSSWYLDEHGRNTTLWPTYTFTFMRELAAFDLGEYVLHPRVERQDAVSA